MAGTGLLASFCVNTSVPLFFYDSRVNVVLSTFQNAKDTIPQKHQTINYPAEARLSFEYITPAYTHFTCWLQIFVDRHNAWYDFTMI